MKSPSQHVCTLCNREFKSPASEIPRCPHCLRRVGVVAVPAEIPSGGRFVLPRPSLRTLVIGGAVAALAILAVVLWQVQPTWLTTTTVADHPVASFCSEHNVPCPVGQTLELPVELAAVASGAELATGMAAVLEGRGKVSRPGAPPDRLRPAAEVLAGSGLKMVALEAVALAWGAAQAANLPLVPCLPDSQLAAEPFWQRGYALCDQQCNLVYAPLPADDGDMTWQCLTAPRFTAHFIAANGELPLPAREAYRLFAAARELHKDPDLTLRQGVVKVRNDAPEFGIEDMRVALHSGAAADGQLLLGSALLSVGLPADALDAFETLLRVAPEDPHGRLGKARSLALLGRMEAAEATLQSLEQTNPDLPGLWAAVASTHRHNKDIEGATSAIRREVAHNPAREHVAFLVDLLLEERREEEAMALLDSLYERLQRADLALMAAQLAGTAGRVEEAQQRLAAALDAHPDNVELLYLTAQRSLDKKEFGAAEEVLMRLRKRDPENVQVQVDLALSRFGLEKAGGHGARSARETVADFARKSPRRVYQVAQVLSSWEYWDETEKLLEERLARKPGSRHLTAWLYFYYLSHQKAGKAKALRGQERPQFDADDLEWLEEAFSRMDERFAKTGVKVDK